MKTTTDKKNNKYIRIEHNSTTQKPIDQEPNTEEADVEIKMIQMSPSFLGMPMWKFFVVKDTK